MPKLRFRKTKLEGVLVIEPPTIFKDLRGVYIEIYNEEKYHAAGITVKFIQDDISISSQNVLRGIHADKKTWKLISCPYGKFYLVIVDCNRRSPDFGKWESFTLSNSDPRQVLVPPKFGVAHLVLSEKAIFHYKQSTYYDRSRQSTYRWDDPAFNIRWPVQNPILSERDSRAID